MELKSEQRIENQQVLEIILNRWLKLTVLLNMCATLLNITVKINICTPNIFTNFSQIKGTVFLSVTLTFCEKVRVKEYLWIISRRTHC